MSDLMLIQDCLPPPPPYSTHDLLYYVILSAAIGGYTILLCVILLRIQRVHHTLTQLQTSIRDLNKIVALFLRFEMADRDHHSGISFDERDDEVYAKALCMNV